jgi:nitroreductase
MPEQPVHPLIAERWSPYAFSDRSVPPEVLRSLLEAARWAPSGNNEQPWHFLVATRDEPRDFQRLLGALMDGNVRWAARAPVLMLVVARLYADYRGHSGYRSYYEVGLAVGALLVQARVLGLEVHQMGGFHQDKARADLSIPEGFAPIAAIALGYYGDRASLPEDLQIKERRVRERKPLAEFVFRAQWSEPAWFVQSSPVPRRTLPVLEP